jgi:hypothetical protein
VIVAKGKLTHRSAPIPTTTIFTPAADGLYRLSVYATITQIDSSSNSYWFYNVGWTNDGGAQDANSIIYGYPQTPVQFIWESTYDIGGPVLTFEAKAGAPVTHQVVQSGPPDNSAYSLYWVVERLE